MPEREEFLTIVTEDFNIGLPVPDPDVDRLTLYDGPRMLFRVGPDGVFEWGEGVTPDEAAEVMAAAITQILGGGMVLEDA